MTGRFSILVYESDGKYYGSAGTDIEANRRLLLGPGRGTEVFCESDDDFDKAKEAMLAEARRRGISHVNNFGDTAIAS